MKKIRLIILVIIFCFIITGCSSNSKTNDISYVTCTRDVYASDANTNIDIKYVIAYGKDGYIKELKSIEKISTNNEEVLKKYEQAYKGVYSVYKDLKYYENKVENNNHVVTSTTTINYEKIDMDKLMKIEGKEDNVKVENGKIKLSDWKEFSKKYGTTCK